MEKNKNKPAQKRSTEKKSATKTKPFTEAQKKAWANKRLLSTRQESFEREFENEPTPSRYGGYYF